MWFIFNLRKITCITSRRGNVWWHMKWMKKRKRKNWVYRKGEHIWAICLITALQAPHLQTCDSRDLSHITARFCLAEHQAGLPRGLPWHPKKNIPSGTYFIQHSTVLLSRVMFSPYPGQPVPTVWAKFKTQLISQDTAFHILLSNKVLKWQGYEHMAPDIKSFLNCHFNL